MNNNIVSNNNFIPAEIGLNHETDLLIKQSHEGSCGVDLPEISNFQNKTGQLSREYWPSSG